jgi:hypothetical protein
MIMADFSFNQVNKLLLPQHPIHNPSQRRPRPLLSQSLKRRCYIKMMHLQIPPVYFIPVPILPAPFFKAFCIAGYWLTLLALSSTRYALTSTPSGYPS